MLYLVADGALVAGGDRVDRLCVPRSRPPAASAEIVSSAVFIAGFDDFCSSSTFRYSTPPSNFFVPVIGADHVVVGGRLGVDLGDHVAQVQHVDVVGNLEDVRQVVTDDQDPDTGLCESPDQGEDLGSLRDTQCRRRFVQDDDLGFLQDRTGDGHGLPLTTGERRTFCRTDFTVRTDSDCRVDAARFSISAP